MMSKTIWKHRPALSLLLIVLIVFQTAGCTYIRVQRLSMENFPSLLDNEKIRMEKHFVVHHEDKIFHLIDPVVKGKELNGSFQPVGYRPVYYYSGRPERYRIWENQVLHEVHLYVKGDYQKAADGNICLQLDDIKEVRIIRSDTGKTVAFVILSTGGIIAGIIVAASVLFFLSL
jgi:hypothetical protein